MSNRLGLPIARQTIIQGGNSRADGYWYRFFAALDTIVSRFVAGGDASPVTKTANFTVADNEHNLIVNKSGSSCTVTLPTASEWKGREIRIKTLQSQTVVSASSNVVPRNSASAGTAILASGAGNWALLISDGANWVIMAGS
jgi:hypothetical protein